MRHWIANISLLAAALMLLSVLPTLGSNGAILLGATLATATACLGCFAADDLAERLPQLLRTWFHA